MNVIIPFMSITLSLAPTVKKLNRAVDFFFVSICHSGGFFFFLKKHFDVLLTKEKP